MPKESPIINNLTAGLDGKLARQIYNEYQDRLRQIRFLVFERDSFSSLRDEMKTVEILLALSIFNKRVIANFDAAIKFQSTVAETGETSTVRMGRFDLDDAERRRLLSVVAAYRKLMDRFQIPAEVMIYDRTWEFLRRVRDLQLGISLDPLPNSEESE